MLMLFRPLKDLVKTLNATLISAVPNPELPKNLLDKLEAFKRHDDATEDDGGQLHKELVEIHKKYFGKVRRLSAQDSLAEDEKLAAFIKVIQILRPKLKGQAKLQDWYKLVIQPILDGVGSTRAEAKAAKELLLDILDHEGDEGDDESERAKTAVHFTNRLIEAYMRRTRIPDADDEELDGEDDVVAQQFEDVLVTYGEKKPKVGWTRVFRSVHMLTFVGIDARAGQTNSQQGYPYASTRPFERFRATSATTLVSSGTNKHHSTLTSMPPDRHIYSCFVVGIVCANHVPASYP